MSDNWKKYIGSQAQYPPPHENTTNKVENGEINNIVTESELASSQGQNDISMINAIVATDDIGYDQGDIILTTVENEAQMNEQIGDVFPSANELRTTQHEVGTQGGTKSGLNFNYNLIENKDIPESEITQFVNIINHVGNQQ